MAAAILQGTPMRHLAISLILVLSAMRVFGEDPPADFPASEIAGTVTDAEGKPLEGALVDVWTWYPGNETRTNKNGHFHLKKFMGRRELELRISKEGFSPWYEPRQPCGVGDLKVALGNKTYFEGTVYSSDGKPIADALVRADS